MDKSSRDDNPSPKLFDCSGNHRVQCPKWQLDQQHGEKHANGTGHQHHEQRPDSQGHIVFSILSIALGLRAASFRFAFSNTVSIVIRSGKPGPYLGGLTRHRHGSGSLRLLHSTLRGYALQRLKPPIELAPRFLLSPCKTYIVSTNPHIITHLKILFSTY